MNPDLLRRAANLIEVLADKVGEQLNVGATVLELRIAANEAEQEREQHAR
jgi:hypothetical protein